MEENEMELKVQKFQITVDYDLPNVPQVLDKENANCLVKMADIFLKKSSRVCSGLATVLMMSKNKEMAEKFKDEFGKLEKQIDNFIDRMLLFNIDELLEDKDNVLPWLIKDLEKRKKELERRICIQ